MHKRERVIDRAIHVRLGGKMHDRLRAMLVQQFSHQGSIADIAANKSGFVRRHHGDRVQVAGVGQFVQVDRVRIVPSGQLADKATTNKASTSVTRIMCVMLLAFFRFYHSARSIFCHSIFCQIIRRADKKLGTKNEQPDCLGAPT